MNAISYMQKCTQQRSALLHLANKTLYNKNNKVFAKYIICKYMN